MSREAGEPVGERGEPLPIPDSLQTRMLWGLQSAYDELPADALERAKRNLGERLAHIGTTERFDALEPARAGVRRRDDERRRAAARLPRERRAARAGESR